MDNLKENNLQDDTDIFCKKSLLQGTQNESEHVSKKDTEKNDVTSNDSEQKLTNQSNGSQESSTYKDIKPCNGNETTHENKLTKFEDTAYIVPTEFDIFKTLCEEAVRSTNTPPLQFDCNVAAFAFTEMYDNASLQICDSFDAAHEGLVKVVTEKRSSNPISPSQPTIGITINKCINQSHSDSDSSESLFDFLDNGSSSSNESSNDAADKSIVLIRQENTNNNDQNEVELLMTEPQIEANNNTTERNLLDGSSTISVSKESAKIYSTLISDEGDDKAILEKNDTEYDEQQDQDQIQNQDQQNQDTQNQVPHNQEKY